MSTPSYGSGIHRVPTREHDRHVRDALKRRVYFRGLVARGILQDPTGGWDVPHHKDSAQDGQGQVEILPPFPSPADWDDPKDGKGKAKGFVLAPSCKAKEVDVRMIGRHPPNYVQDVHGGEWNDSHGLATTKHGDRHSDDDCYEK